jgi:hypothetical protein
LIVGFTPFQQYFSHIIASFWHNECIILHVSTTHMQAYYPYESIIHIPLNNMSLPIHHLPPPKHHLPPHTCHHLYTTTCLAATPDACQNTLVTALPLKPDRAKPDAFDIHCSKIYHPYPCMLPLNNMPYILAPPTHHLPTPPTHHSHTTTLTPLLA